MVRKAFKCECGKTFAAAVAPDCATATCTCKRQAKAVSRPQIRSKQAPKSITEQLNEKRAEVLANHKEMLKREQSNKRFT